MAALQGEQESAWDRTMNTIEVEDVGKLDLPDDTVGSLAQLFRYYVSLVDNEILVEHLEGLPSLKSEVRHCDTGSGINGCELVYQDARSPNKL